MNTLTLRLHRFLPLAMLTLAAACGGEPADEAPAASEPAAEAAPAMEATASDGLMDPNDASREQLTAVEGLDAAAVDALIEGRPYADMLEVDAVLAEHMDEAGRETVYASVWKRLDLNAASGDEILLIPGVGERMEHEFEEYRPYRAMAEFHREIGKYVDEAELERLAQYVELRSAAP